MPSHYSNAASSAYSGYKKGQAIGNATVLGSRIGQMAASGAQGAMNVGMAHQRFHETLGRDGKGTGYSRVDKAFDNFNTGIAMLRSQQSRIHEARNTVRVGMYRDADPQTPYVNRAFQR